MQQVKLRKCPACKNMITAESPWCPRCGISIRGRALRRFLFWLIVLGVVGWLTREWWGPKAAKYLPVEKVWPAMKQQALELRQGALPDA